MTETTYEASLGAVDTALTATQLVAMTDTQLNALSASQVAVL